jgi:hypothetical protein
MQTKTKPWIPPAWVLEGWKLKPSSHKARPLNKNAEDLSHLPLMVEASHDI